MVRAAPPAGPLRGCSHVLERPDLALADELGPVHPVQLHELAGNLPRVLIGCRLDERESADRFLRLGERAVRHLERAATRSDTESAAGRFQTGRVFQRAVLEPLLDE